MHSTNPLLLTVEIPKFDKRSDSVYYLVEIQAEGKKKWNIDKTFKDFEEIHKKIAKKLPSTPYLPAKSFFSLSEEQLEKRREELEILVARGDAIADTDFRNFIDVYSFEAFNLKLDRNVKTEKLTKVKKICEIHNLPMSCKDFIYSPKAGVLFLLLSETSVVSKIGAIFGTGKEQTLSAIIAYKEDVPGSFEFYKLWRHDFDKEASIICWDEELTILAIGFTKGEIICFRVTTEQDYSKYEEYCKLQCHTQLITGLALFSQSEKEHIYPLTALYYDKKNHRIFVSDSLGTLYIYNPEDQFTLVCTINFPVENYAKAFFFDDLRNILLSGSNQGTIVIYEIGKAGKEKLSSLTGSFDAIKNIKALHFIGHKKELYVAGGTGQVGFINTLTTQPFCKFLIQILPKDVLDAHTEEVTQMTYLEGKRALITCSKDRSIRFWRYPIEQNEDGGSFRSAVIGEKKPGEPPKPRSNPIPAEEKVEKTDERKKESTKAAPPKPKKRDDSSEEERSGPLPLLKYRPAVEKDEDRESSEDEPIEIKKPTKRKDSPPKRRDSSDEDNRKNKRAVSPLSSPESDDEKMAKVKASPKSFLFKNSIEPTIKNSKKEDRKDVKKNVDDNENKKNIIKSKPVKKDSDSSSDEDSSKPKNFLFKNAVEPTVKKEDLTKKVENPEQKSEQKPEPVKQPVKKPEATKKPDNKVDPLLGIPGLGGGAIVAEAKFLPIKKEPPKKKPLEQKPKPVESSEVKTEQKADTKENKEKQESESKQVSDSQENRTGVEENQEKKIEESKSESSIQKDERISEPIVKPQDDKNEQKIEETVGSELKPENLPPSSDETPKAENNLQSSPAEKKEVLELVAPKTEATSENQSLSEISSPEKNKSEVSSPSKTGTEPSSEKSLDSVNQPKKEEESKDESKYKSGSKKNSVQTADILIKESKVSKKEPKKSDKPKKKEDIWAVLSEPKSIEETEELTKSEPRKSEKGKKKDDIWAVLSEPKSTDELEETVKENMKKKTAKEDKSEKVDKSEKGQVENIESTENLKEKSAKTQKKEDELNAMAQKMKEMEEMMKKMQEEKDRLEKETKIKAKAEIYSDEDESYKSKPKKSETKKEETEKSKKVSKRYDEDNNDEEERARPSKATKSKKGKKDSDSESPVRFDEMPTKTEKPIPKFVSHGDSDNEEDLAGWDNQS